MKPMIYMAGPCPVPDLGLQWRLDLSRKLSKDGIIGLNPLRNQRGINDKLYTDRMVTELDLMDISKCDLLFANFLEDNNVLSKGTILEIGYALGLGMPVVVAINKNNPNEHFMIENSAIAYMDNMEDALEIINNILLV